MCLLPLSPHTQHTNSNIYVNLVNMQPCLLSVRSFIVEEWGGNHCWMKSDSAPYSGSSAWRCPIPSRIRQGVFFRGGTLLSGQAGIIVFLTTWLQQEGRKTKVIHICLSGTGSTKGFTCLAVLKWTVLSSTIQVINNSIR